MLSKTRIWIAISSIVYVLVAIVKKRLQLLPASLYEILQILSLTMFERMPIDRITFAAADDVVTEAVSPNQLTLFD